MRVLVDELQHRTRNLMSVVMAMLEKTGVAGQTLDEFKASLRDRLMALPACRDCCRARRPARGSHSTVFANLNSPPNPKTTEA